jgi:hypothetical protein
MAYPAHRYSVGGDAFYGMRDLRGPHVGASQLNERQHHLTQHLSSSAPPLPMGGGAVGVGPAPSTVLGGVATGGGGGGGALDAEKTVAKFKTKVCIFWLQPRGCPYGDRCLYAHGDNELRDDLVGGAPGADPDANPRYKTRMCKWWASSNGQHCPHGVRCTYAHGVEELEK